MKYLILFLTVIVSQVFAADWSHIHTFKNGTKVYSAESYELTDGTLRTFIKLVQGKKSFSPYAILIDCESRLVRNYVAGAQGSEFFIPWEPIEPDSVGEAVVNSYCKNLLKRKEAKAQEKVAQEKIQKENEALLQAELIKNGYSLIKKDNNNNSFLNTFVRINITFSDLQLQAVKGNPEVEVEVVCNPTGEILGKKLIRTSGNQAWDEAVMSAIDKTGTLPRNGNGAMPPKITLTFRPRDYSWQ